MYIFLYIITHSILVNADIDTIISDENFDSYKGEIIRKAGKSADGIPRRFLDDLSDHEFHISHLKDSDFKSGRKHCKGETFEDRVVKYKNMLLNDASRVQFVSADAIAVDEKDLVPEKCEEVDDVSDTNTQNKTEEKTAAENVATTVKEEKKDGRRAIKKKQRRSEYQFSSIEYYDEVPDFDPKVCPEAVEVIHLQLDPIKVYDVECEIMLQWQSLE